MKKSFLLTLALALSAAAAVAQEVKLPAPQKKGGKTFLETLWARQSTTEFGTRQLSRQDLSNLLWAATGVNRKDGRLTSPTARNMQEIRVFVFTAEGVSEYQNKEHSLRRVAEGDHRALIAGRQDFVKQAPVSLLLVADGTKFGRNDERSLTMMAVDAGIVCENINLYCAAQGLVTRPRASMDVDAIKQLLQLDDTQFPLMNNPVGYAK